MMSTASGPPNLSATNTTGLYGNVVIPKGVGVSAVRLPPKVDSSGFRLVVAPPPLTRIVVGSTRLYGKTGNNLAVEPSFKSAIGTQVVFKTFPSAGGKSSRRGDALRGEVGKSRVVRLAVVH